jgi:hypothetical protein
MRSPCCLCVCVSPSPTTFEWLDQSLRNLVCTHISWHLIPSHWRASWISPSSLSVCICIPLSLLRNGSVKNIIATTNTRVCYFLCGPYRTKKSRRLVLSRTPCIFLVFFQSIHKNDYLLLALTHFFNSSANYENFQCREESRWPGNFYKNPQ